MKKLTSLSILLVVCATAFSQLKSRKGGGIEYINSLQLTGGLGTGTYFGDLCDNFDCAVFRPNSNIGIIYRNSERLLLRADFHYIRLFGTDEGGANYDRNLHFRSSNYEGMISAIYDLIPYERKFRYRSTFTPYAHGGLGFTFFSPKAKLNGKWEKLRKHKTEGVSYGRVTPTISYGVGLRFKINPKLNIASEIGYRWTFTDYLDDVSNVYVDNSSFESETAKKLADRSSESNLEINNRDYDQASQSWKAGHIRGNPKRKDGYFLFELKAEYRIKWMSQGGSILRKAKFR